MAAAAPNDPAPHPLARRASPAVITQWLFPHDVSRFVAEYTSAARDSLELGEVHEVVERCRRIGILETDPEAYRRTMRRAAELATGRPSPPDEPLDVTTTKAGL